MRHCIRSRRNHLVKLEYIRVKAQSHQGRRRLHGFCLFPEIPFYDTAVLHWCCFRVSTEWACRRIAQQRTAAASCHSPCSVCPGGYKGLQSDFLLPKQCQPDNHQSAERICCRPSFYFEYIPAVFQPCASRQNQAHRKNDVIPSMRFVSRNQILKFCQLRRVHHFQKIIKIINGFYYGKVTVLDCSFFTYVIWIS